MSKSHQGRGDKTITGRVHTGSAIYHMVDKRGIGKKVEWWIEDVCRLDKLEQGMP